MCTLLALALISFNSSAYILAASCTNMQLHARAGALPFQLETEMEAPCAKLVLRTKRKYIYFLISSPALSHGHVPGRSGTEGIRREVSFSIPALGFWVPDMVTEWSLQQIPQLAGACPRCAAGWGGRGQRAAATSPVDCRALGLPWQPRLWGEFRLSRRSHVRDFTAKKLWINSAYAEQNIN